MSTVARRAAWVALAAFAVQALGVALFKHFSRDEFMFAHAAWEVAQGSLPYRDFFVAHHPLSFVVFAWPFALLGDSPTHLVWLRVTMVVSLTVTVLSGWLIGRAHGRLSAWLVALLVLSTPVVVEFAVEVRADGLAWTLLFGAIAVLHLERWSDVARGAVAGVLVSLAVVAHQKALLWGLAFPAALVIDIVHNRRRGERLLLGDARAFVVAAAAGATPAIVWVLAHGLAAELFENAWLWAFAQQRGRHALNLVRWDTLGGFLALSGWLIPLGSFAAWRSVRAGRRWLSNPDFFLVVTAILATLYAATARAPYAYYLIPAGTLWAVLGARGLADLWSSELRVRGKLAVVTLALLLVAIGHVYLATLASNEGQRETLRTIERLTEASDCVYDNTGFAVARPAAHRIFMTDSYLRQTLGDVLEREMPAAIVERGCPVSVRDTREQYVPPGLKRFLAEHYQAYDEYVRVWGQQFDSDGRFNAVVPGSYFVDPPDTALAIDGEPIDAPIFELERGTHAVELRGPARRFTLLWLPRDGHTFVPDDSISGT